MKNINFSVNEFYLMIEVSPKSFLALLSPEMLDLSKWASFLVSVWFRVFESVFELFEVTFQKILNFKKKIDNPGEQA